MENGRNLQHAMTSRLLYIAPDKYEKYNVRGKCLKFSFSEESIEALQAKYRSLRGQPKFIDDLLHGNPVSGDIPMFRRRPELLEWSDDGDIVVRPNYESLTLRDNIENIILDPRQMKRQRGGFELMAWYIHPKQLEESIFCDKVKREDFRNTENIYTYVPELEPCNEIERRIDRERIHEIEEISGIPYLASVLDLKPEHVPWLKSMKELVDQHLHKVYGVDANDVVQMFFHIVTGESTATLHLHVRVNQVLHPFEKAKSVMLDDLINLLEKGKTVESLLLERDIPMGINGELVRMCMELPGVTIEEIPNPYILSTPLEKINIPIKRQR